MVLTAEMLRCYVPRFLASRFLARPTPLDAPGVERFWAAVLFADISGFTPLAERLARRGPAGAEDLSDLLNAYFGELTSLIAEHGGEVITFAGDGLLAVWPAATGTRAWSPRPATPGSAPWPCSRHWRATRRSTALGSRCGLVSGPVRSWRSTSAGSVGAGSSCCPARRSFRASLAEQRAAPGEVVLSPEAWELGHDSCQA